MLKSSLFALSLSVLALGSAAAQPDIRLHQVPKVNGFAFSSDGFTVGSPMGALSVDWSGKVVSLSKQRFGLTEMVGHPAKPDVFIASGYKSETEKAGVIKSTDGGKTWARIDSTTPPAAFQAMAIDHANPDLLYGADEKAISRSTDGGATWTEVATLPNSAFDLSLSTKAVYAATLKGLLKSTDGGKTWDQAIEQPVPTTMVHVTPNGRIFAFVYATGLVSTMEDTLDWKVVSAEFGPRALMDFAIDPNKPARMLGVAETGAVMISQNGGANWTGFEGHRLATPEIVKAGETLFNNNCAACHGPKGAGIEGSVAPPLDNSAHAWHHADSDLMDMIRNGSDRNPDTPMPAWKKTLSDPEIASIIGYIKSNWSFSSLACQGGRHMGCM